MLHVIFLVLAAIAPLGLVAIALYLLHRYGLLRMARLLMDSQVHGDYQLDYRDVAPYWLWELCGDRLDYYLWCGWKPWGWGWATFNAEVTHSHRAWVGAWAVVAGLEDDAPQIF